MLYKFKSQSEAELIMLQPDGDQILSMVGKELALQGVITAEQIPAAIRALETALDSHERAQANHPGNTSLESEPTEGNVPLRHRAFPFIEMLKHSAAAGKDVVWGV